MEERELMGLRDWEIKNTATLNSMKRVRMSTPKPNSLYPSLKALQQQDQVFTSKNCINSSLNVEEKDGFTIPTRRTPAKKVEPTILRENISISRLGWNRDLSSVRKRCRSDANLKAAAFLSKH